MPGIGFYFGFDKRLKQNHTRLDRFVIMIPFLVFLIDKE
jgi:hypothetical protein